MKNLVFFIMTMFILTSIHACSASSSKTSKVAIDESSQSTISQTAINQSSQPTTSNITNSKEKPSIPIAKTPITKTEKIINPQDACSFMSSIDGLQTGEYKTLYNDNEYTCFSFYKPFGKYEEFTSQNNISYYVNGIANKATELQLVLKVNNKSQAKEAHKMLINCTNILVNKAFDLTMPQKISNTIISGNSGKWKIGKSQVILTRENWDTGKGYSMTLSINLI